MLNSHSRVILPKRPVTTSHGINRDISDEHKRIWRGLDFDETFRAIERQHRFERRLILSVIAAGSLTGVISAILLILKATGVM